MSTLKIIVFCILSSIAFASGAQTSSATTGGISGSFQLSGGGMGCARIDNQTLFISFPTPFQSAPTLNVTSSRGPGDSVNVANVVAGRYGFTVTVTTAGSHQDEVCGVSAINWTAYGALDQKTKSPNQSGVLSLTSHGCVSLNGQGVGLAFPHPFESQPQFVTVYGTDTSPDSVHANVVNTSKDGATFSTFTYGQNGNQVCGSATLVWSAGNRD